MGPFIGLSLLILVAYGILRNSGERKHRQLEQQHYWQEKIEAAYRKGYQDGIMTQTQINKLEQH